MESCYLYGIFPINLENDVDQCDLDGIMNKRFKLCIHCLAVHHEIINTGYRSKVKPDRISLSDYGWLFFVKRSMIAWFAIRKIYSPVIMTPHAALT